MADARVSTLRELFRHLNAWKALCESDGLDTITDPSGTEWSLWDVEYLAMEGTSYLSTRQQQAIRWYLVAGLRESDVAEMMGIDPKNPVGMYATDGIKRLLVLIDSGDIPRFRLDEKAA